MKASQLIPGDILILPNGQTEVVRGSFMVIQLANGQDQRYGATEDVMIVDQSVRPPLQPDRPVAGQVTEAMPPPVPLAKPVPEESAPSAEPPKP